MASQRVYATLFAVFVIGLTFSIFYKFDSLNLRMLQVKTMVSKIEQPLMTSPVQVSNANNKKHKLLFLGESKASLNPGMSLDEADKQFYSYIFHRHYSCAYSTRFGKSDDGGWDICLAEPFNIVQPCLIYSFGISYDFSFDDAVALQFGCTVRSFDPSMDKVKDHQRSPNIWFYKTGISGTDIVSPKGWRLRKLSSIVNELGDTNKTIDYLKMDVEGSEWESLEAMYNTGILQSRVKQIGFEIHQLSLASRTVNAFNRFYKILKRLEDIGFRRWYWHFNRYNYYKFNGRGRSRCYEMVYINTRFLNTTTVSKQ